MLVRISIRAIDDNCSKKHRQMSAAAELNYAYLSDISKNPCYPDTQ